MAGRPRNSRRVDRDSDSMEALKPLVVLVLFGTILYGAYSVVQKGPSGGDSTAAPVTSDAPPFGPPVVEVPTGPAGGSRQPPSSIAPAVSTQPAPGSPTGVPAVTAGRAPESPAAASGLPGQAVAPVPAMPIEPPVNQMPSAAQGALPAVAAATATVAAIERNSVQTSPTYLTAESAPPPAPDSLGGSAVPNPRPPAGERPDRYATLPTTPSVPVSVPPGNPVSAPSSASATSSSAFAMAWADAHDKLASGRYAEALAALSIWYDDPSLGLEESQRLEDLLGQLAGTVIYSPQDLVLPPYVVAAGETLPTIAKPLGVSWQLLGKINGITDPQGLIPGEHLKVIRGPFDAVVSVSRRRLSLQLGGYYAGSFPVLVGHDFMMRVGNSISVADGGLANVTGAQPSAGASPEASPRGSISLADGLRIDAVDDPGLLSENSPSMSLVVSARDFADLVDILGPGSKVLIRQ